MTVHHAPSLPSSLLGPLRFAHYAYPPNALGYCGPADAAELRDAVDATDARTLNALALCFEGAMPYLRLVASCNGIDDPLDERVVDAYWVGNPLLERVEPSLLARLLSERFERRAGGLLPNMIEAAFNGGVAHHSFHVFAVSPFVGMLRSGHAQAALVVLDRCRIRWGTVEAVSGASAVVRTRPLVLRSDRLALGAPELETVCWRVPRIDGHPGAVALAPGDDVALHWDWVCERLSRESHLRLVAATLRNLAAVNAAREPTVAIALEQRGG